METTNTKKIIIIGGGIGGMATLHYLKRRYALENNVKIQLLEASNRVGGTIQSSKDDDFTFESGPNGFLNSNPRTLSFIHDIGLDDELITADDDAKIRYICSEDKLYKLPSSPVSFLKFPLLSLSEKLRVLGDFFTPKGRHSWETIYDFGSRRFGKRFTEIFLDSMVGGIFGGNSHKLILKYSFPRIYELEQKFGSLFRAQMLIKKSKVKNSIGAPKGHLCSFHNGMEEVFHKLYRDHRSNIQLNTKVKSLNYDGQTYTIATAKEKIKADAVIGGAPAYKLSPIFATMDNHISAQLDKIHYAPIGVVGLGYDRYALPQIPKGFGYLIPALDNKEALGVLFENQIFPSRYPKYHSLFRIMIGGARRPEVANYHEGEIEEIAKKELKYTLGITAVPHKTFVKIWPKAIPQYDLNYCESHKIISEQLEHYPNVHFAANFWNGISFNDCIENAYQIAQKIDLTLHPTQIKAAKT